MRSKTILGVCLLARIVSATPTWAAPFHAEKQFPLPSGGQLLVRSEAGGVDVRGGEGEVATVTVTSDRSDFANKFDVRFDDSQPGRLEVVVERKGSGRLLSFNWGGDTRVEVASAGSR